MSIQSERNTSCLFNGLFIKIKYIFYIFSCFTVTFAANKIESWKEMIALSVKLIIGIIRYSHKRLD
jgi:hypothetical protein